MFTRISNSNAGFFAGFEKQFTNFLKRFKKEVVVYPICRWFVVVAASILMGLSGSAATYGTTVEGYCYLEGETNHAGTRVEFFKYPLGLYCKETFTIASGHYSTWVGATMT